MTSRMSSTRLLSLSEFLMLSKKPSTLLCFSNGSSSLAMFFSFLMIHVCQSQVHDIGEQQAYLSRIYLLYFPLVSPSGTGAESNTASALTRGASDSIDCLFAFIFWGAGEHRRLQKRSGPYLAIVQDETETSGDRPKRTKGIRSFLNPMKDPFGPRGCGRLEVQFGPR